MPKSHLIFFIKYNLVKKCPKSNFRSFPIESYISGSFSRIDRQNRLSGLEDLLFFTFFYHDPKNTQWRVRNVKYRNLGYKWNNFVKNGPIVEFLLQNKIYSIVDNISQNQQNRLANKKTAFARSGSIFKCEKWPFSTI